MDVTVTGTGPEVMIVHGTPGGSDAAIVCAKWLGLLPGFRVIAPSRPGYCGTPLSEGVLMAEQADFLARVLDRYASGPVAVVGVSGGGPAACELAIRHPNRVQSLALLCAVTARDQRSRWPEQLLLAVAPALTWIPIPLLQMALPVGDRRAGFINDDRQFRSLAPLGLEAIRCPTFLVHGNWDTAVDYRSALRAHRRIPKSELLTIPCGSHLAPLLKSSGAPQKLRQFLRSSST